MGVLSQPFLQFGDSAYYAPVKGGSFRGPLGSWTPNTASVMSGGDPWNVSNAPAPDRRMLQISGGGEAVSPNFLPEQRVSDLAVLPPERRSSPASALNVWVQWRDAQGNSGQVPVTALDGSSYGSWSPSSTLVAGSDLADGATVNAQLVFNAKPGDAWNVDDVYVDPYAR